jgi:hypothetical protein
MSENLNEDSIVVLLESIKDDNKSKYFWESLYGANNNKQINVECTIVEESEDIYRAYFLNVGVPTENRNVYTKDVGQQIYNYLDSLNEDSKVYPEMLISHAYSDNGSEIIGTAGKIVGVGIDKKDSKIVEDGDILYIRFKLLETSAGRDLKVLIRERVTIERVSLRVNVKSGGYRYNEESGVYIVTDVDPQTFAVDFTSVIGRAAMPFDNNDHKGIKKESIKNKERNMPKERTEQEFEETAEETEEKKPVEEINVEKNSSRNSDVIEKYQSLLERTEKLEENLKRQELENSKKERRSIIKSIVEEKLSGLPREQKKKVFDAMEGVGESFDNIKNLRTTVEGLCDSIASTYAEKAKEKIMEESNLNTLPDNVRKLEEWREVSGMPEGFEPSIGDVLVSRMLGESVYKDGFHKIRDHIIGGKVFEAFMNTRNLPLIESGNAVLDSSTSILEMEGKLRQFTEGDKTIDIDSLNVLPPSIITYIVALGYMDSMIANMANVVRAVKTPEYRHEFVSFTDARLHRFGSVAYGAGLVDSGTHTDGKPLDDGACEYPDHVFAKVITPFDNPVLITITGENEAGDTIYAMARVGKGDVENSRFKKNTVSTFRTGYNDSGTWIWTPGQKFKDVTAASIADADGSNPATVGEVIIGKQDERTVMSRSNASQIAKHQRMVFKMSNILSEVSCFTASMEITMQQIYDLSKQAYAGNFGSATNIGNMIRNRLRRMVDQEGLAQLGDPWMSIECDLTAAASEEGTRAKRERNLIESLLKAGNLVGYSTLFEFDPSHFMFSKGDNDILLYLNDHINGNGNLLAGPDKGTIRTTGTKTFEHEILDYGSSRVISNRNIGLYLYRPWYIDMRQSNEYETNNVIIGGSEIGIEAPVSEDTQVEITFKRS